MERTHVPLAIFFDVQVIVVLTLLHVKRAVVLPFLAVAEYDTPVTLGKVAFTIPRVAVILTLLGAATVLSTRLTGAFVEAGAVVAVAFGAVVGVAVAGVEDGVAVLKRIFGEEYVKPVTDTVNRESLNAIFFETVLVAPVAVSITSTSSTDEAL
jgi:hypothetical protein